MVGRVTEEEKWRLLGSVDLLCAPSLGGESFGMVLTEAFASGTPVVASDIAGYRDVVRHGVDGLLVPAGDPVELGEALRSLASDPARRERMAVAARERAERFSWPRVAAEVTEVYEHAVALPRPEARPRPRGAAGGGRARGARSPRAGRSASPRWSRTTGPAAGAPRLAWRGGWRSASAPQPVPGSPCWRSNGSGSSPSAMRSLPPRPSGCWSASCSCASRCWCAPRPGTRSSARRCPGRACAGATPRGQP